jgi:cytochrome P450
MAVTDSSTPSAAGPANPTGAHPPRRIADLPGPKGLPKLGNALQVKRERLHQQAEAWAKEFGEVYRFSIGEREFVVLSNPEVVAGVLRDRPEGFSRTARMTEIAREFGFDGVFTANGEKWRRQRPMVLAGLDPTHIKAFFPTLVKVTERLRHRWHRHAANGRPMDLQAELMRFTVDVTAGLAFGTDINTIGSDDEVIQQHLDKILPALFRRLMAPLPYWHWFRLPGDRALEGHLAALTEAVQGFIQSARRRLAHEPVRQERPVNLIEAMLVERDREGSELTDADVAGNVLTMLLAGEDTTANTLAWAIWLLNEHPQIAVRASNEVSAALGGQACPTRYDQLGRLDFIEACIHETMRLKPVAPIIVQQAAKEREVAGVLLPAGTLVMCLIRPAALDDARFPRACEFDPDRWLANGGHAAQAASSAKRVVMPFGAGPRICPGRYLALAEMKMVLAMLLASFRIESVDTPDGLPVQERLALTMSPVGLRMALGSAVD